ncbi:hypothetical protein E4N77_07975 [Treponema denticola]|nr:hypothetical protein E4N77_07975 [Treponema denticola]
MRVSTPLSEKIGNRQTAKNMNSVLIFFIKIS